MPTTLETSGAVRDAAATPAILLAGAGEIAAEYVKALRVAGVDPGRIRVVGRSVESCARFARESGVPCVPGGTAALSTVPVPDAAIVAVSHLSLYETALALLDGGCRFVLLEKPGALERRHLEQLDARARDTGAAVFMALNRRFFPSVDLARRIIAEDGGLLSCFFDFTEVEAQVLAAAAAKQWTPDVLRKLGIVNSLHVIDLFLHLAGMPREWQQYRDGGLSWHPGASRFAGAGVTDRNVVFSYLATWDGAGRWGVELTTPQRKLVLRPLESVACQVKGSFAVEALSVAPEPTGLKPGFLAQAGAFLAAAAGGPVDSRLCTLADALAHVDIVQRIIGYES